jgi:hypothetical protein
MVSLFYIIQREIPVYIPSSVLIKRVSFMYNIMNGVMKFQVLTATGMKMAVFWDVAPCILVVSTSETSVSFYQTTRRNTVEDSIFKLISVHHLYDFVYII